MPEIIMSGEAASNLLGSLLELYEYLTLDELTDDQKVYAAEVTDGLALTIQDALREAGIPIVWLPYSDEVQDSVRGANQYYTGNITVQP